MTFTQHYYVTGNWKQHTFEIGPSKITTRASVVNLAVFPRSWACFFVDLRYFGGLARCLFLSLFQLKFACFLGLFFADFSFADCFFQILWHFCCFNLLRKAYWACFHENLLILGLFFQICLPAFLFNFLADFSFCWIFPPTRVGLVFRLNYRFLACFSSLLVCFCKIAWHHWLAVAACGENGREGCEISSLVEHTGLSPCPWLFIMAFTVTPAVLNLSNW